MQKHPNFFIIGAPKAGTTALSEYLRGHPAIFFPETKEPHFFSPDIKSRHRVARLKDYQRLFAAAPSGAAVIGEASVHYLQSDVALHNILSHAPAAKILVMLRNPVDLAPAWHAEARYSEFETERSFACAWHDRVVAGHSYRGKGDARLMDYAAVAAIGTQLRRVVALVPPRQLKVVLFDDFVSDTRAVYKDILDFLGLPDDGRLHFPRINQRKRVRSVIAMQLSHALAGFKRRLGITTKLGLIEWLNIDRNPDDAVSPELRFELISWFESEIAQIEEILHIDLRHWRL